MKVNARGLKTLVLQKEKRGWIIGRYIIDTNLKGSWADLLLSISKIKGISFPYFKPETAEKYLKGRR